MRRTKIAPEVRAVLVAARRLRTAGRYIAKADSVTQRQWWRWVGAHCDLAIALENMDADRTDRAG